MSNQQEADAASVLSQMSQMVHLSPDLTTSLGSEFPLSERVKDKDFGSMKQNAVDSTVYETSEHAYAQNSESGSVNLIERNKEDISRDTKKHKCSVCGKMFSKLYNLRAHSVVHTKERPHQCLVCGKAFALYGDLLRHGRIHSGEKPYQCGRCGHCFTDYGTYKRHSRLHTNDYPYKCQVCYKVFNRLDSYNNHMLTHSREKPFVCEYCNKEFNYNSSYKRHLRSHGSEWAYSCQICDKKFTRRDSLKCHSRVHDVTSESMKTETVSKGEDVIVSSLALENDLVIGGGMEAVSTVCSDQILSLPATYVNQQPLCLEIGDSSSDALLSLRDAMQNELSGRNTGLQFSGGNADAAEVEIRSTAQESHVLACTSVSNNTGINLISRIDEDTQGNSMSFLPSLVENSVSNTLEDEKKLPDEPDDRHFASVSVQTEPIFNESPEAMREFLSSIDSLMNPASSLATTESVDNARRDVPFFDPETETSPRPNDFSAVNNLIKSIATPLLELIQRKNKPGNANHSFCHSAQTAVRPENSAVFSSGETTPTPMSTERREIPVMASPFVSPHSSYNARFINQKENCKEDHSLSQPKSSVLIDDKVRTEHNPWNIMVRNLVSDTAEQKVQSPSTIVNELRQPWHAPAVAAIGEDATTAQVANASLLGATHTSSTIASSEFNALRNSQNQNVSQLCSNGVPRCETEDAKRDPEIQLPHQIMEDDPEVCSAECQTLN